MAAMQMSNRPIAFSEGCNYLAYSGPDGRIKIWETATGILKQEYTPSSHLSALCTCLAWGPELIVDNVVSPKKRKQSSKGFLKTVEGLGLLALGTQKGSVLLYSFYNGDLHTEMSGGHTSSVNDVCWDLDDDSIFTCSDDQQVVQWSISKGIVRSKWVADSVAVCSLAIFPDRKSLLSAGRSIKLWNLETKKLVKTFTGHASNIFRLHVVTSDYFISAARGDRMICAWQASQLHKSSLASFALTDEAMTMETLHRDQKILVASVTRGGVFHVFEHQLNGKCKKPLSPVVTLQVSSSNNESVCPVPTICGKICDDQERRVVVAFGDFMNVGFEKLPYASLEPNMSLVRNMSTIGSNNIKEKGLNVKTPARPDGARLLAPAFMVSKRPVDRDSALLSQKRKPQDDGTSETQSLESRVKALNEAGPSKNSTEPRAVHRDTLLNLLMQGIRGQDKKILNEVFSEKDGDLIDRTVLHLPVSGIPVLIKEIYGRVFENSANRGPSLFMWLRAILVHHSSYLSTCFDSEAFLGPLYQLMESRLMLFGKMSQLKGRVDLVLSQVNSKTQTVSAAPLCSYDDESDDESNEYISDLLQSDAQSEDNSWQDLTDEEDEMEMDGDEESKEESD